MLTSDPVNPEEEVAAVTFTAVAPTKFDVFALSLLPTVPVAAVLALLTLPIR